MEKIAVAILLAESVGQFGRVAVVFGRGGNGLVGLGHLRQLVRNLCGVRHWWLVADVGRDVVGTLQKVHKERLSGITAASVIG